LKLPGRIVKPFFTGDTGPGLDNIWQHIKPDVIICDVTFPNKLKAIAKDAGHLCPELLMNELILFQQLKGYLPEIVATHLSPQHEKVIEKELNLVSGKMKVHITIAHEKNELSI
jgi:ribonuclease BN (tRNA processing enzyme)